MTKKQETDAKRAVASQQTKRETDRAVRGRKAWEGSEAGTHRLRDVVDYATEQHNKVALGRPELGLTAHKRQKITSQQAYEHYGFSEEHTGPGMQDRQIPGLEDPDALPQPKRWEEHTPAEQKDIAGRVKHQTGATLDSMSRSLGSQLDQAYLRARHVGVDQPYNQNFYTSGEPARVMRDTAKRRGVSLGLVAATNADTSPQMRFSHTYPAGSKNGSGVRYPNAEQAEHSIAHIQAGGKPEDITKEGLTGYARTGFHQNLTKAARRAHQVLVGGKSVSETFAGTSGSGFGPKTAAYHNSWLTGTPDFTVSDIHTGGGALPHLPTQKPGILDASGERAKYEGGNPKISKSQREKGVEVSGFHAMNDYTMRQAMGQRGLGRVRQAQATQWGEERIHRHENESNPQVKAAFPSTDKAYPAPKTPEFDSGFHQGRLF